jgi:hypothetical protein
MGESIKVTERGGGRRKYLLNDLQKHRGYWKLKEGALDRLCGELALEGAIDLS